MSPVTVTSKSHIFRWIMVWEAIGTFEDEVTLLEGTNAKLAMPLDEIRCPIFAFYSNYWPWKVYSKSTICSNELQRLGIKCVDIFYIPCCYSFSLHGWPKELHRSGSISYPVSSRVWAPNLVQHSNLISFSLKQQSHITCMAKKSVLPDFQSCAPCTLAHMLTYPPDQAPPFLSPSFTFSLLSIWSYLIDTLYPSYHVTGCWES